jgi:hypothetical protein
MAAILAVAADQGQVVQQSRGSDQGIDRLDSSDGTQGDGLLKSAVVDREFSQK